MVFNLDDYDYNLPKELIAQKPTIPRRNSRLMLIDENEKLIKDLLFYQINDLLNKGDTIVLNSSGVKKTKLNGKKITGGKASITVLDFINKDNNEKTLIKCFINAKNPKEETKLIFDYKKDLIEGIIKERDNKYFIVEFNKSKNNLSFKEFLNKFGDYTVPPYIKSDFNKELYQNVFADSYDSIASATAGLHFDEFLIDKLRSKGVNFAYIKLHVGLGTFEDVKTNDIRKHKMHSEYFEIDKYNADLINKTIDNNKKLFIVGTTSLRALESSNINGKIVPNKGNTNIFIYPGYKFKTNIYGFITNFHLPKTTLLMLVSAYLSFKYFKKNINSQKNMKNQERELNNTELKYGLKRLKEIYNHAIKMKYKFYSLGDAMLII